MKRFRKDSETHSRSQRPTTFFPSKRMSAERRFPMRNIRTSLAVAGAVLTCLWVGVTPAYATFPGQNGLIAFAAQATPDAHYEIYTVRKNGHDLRKNNVIAIAKINVLDFIHSDSDRPGSDQILRWSSVRHIRR